MIYNAHSEVISIDHTIPEGCEYLIYHGELDGYDAFSYVDKNDVQHIGVGCRHYTLQEALDHWNPNGSHRPEIEALCAYLVTLCTLRNTKIDYPKGEVVIRTTYEFLRDLQKQIVENAADGGDDSVDMVDTLIGMATPVVQDAEDDEPVPPEPKTVRSVRAKTPA